MTSEKAEKFDWDLLGFPLEDPNWLGKAVVGGAIGMVGMVLLPLLLLIWGYGVRVMRQTMRGDSPYLPEWSDWRKMYADGFRMYLVALVYSLPALLLAVPGVALWVLAFSPYLFEQAGTLSLAGSLGLLGLGFVVLTLAVLVSIPLAYFGLVAHARAVADESLRSAFRFGEVWQLSKTGSPEFGKIFLVWNGVLIVVSTLVGLLSFTIVLVCLYPLLIGVLLTYSSVVTGALFGAAYRTVQFSLTATGDNR